MKIGHFASTLACLFLSATDASPSPPTEKAITRVTSLPLYHERGTPLPSTRRLAETLGANGNGTSIAAGGDIWCVV